MFKFYYSCYFFIFFIIFSSNSFASTWKRSVEGGISIENGNSESESFYGNTKIDYDSGNKWKDIFNARGENKKENEERSKEEYRVNNQTRYVVTTLNYSFLELEYVDDRYGGYDYRISETIGLGRNIIKTDNINLTAQFSTGLRQIKFSDQDKEDSLVARLGSNLEWKLNSTVSFNEDFDISIDNNARITRSDSNLKIMMNKSLYLKISLFIENKSNVPEGIKNTDNRTMVIIGYDF